MRRRGVLEAYLARGRQNIRLEWYSTDTWPPNGANHDYEDRGSVQKPQTLPCITVASLSQNAYTTIALLKRNTVRSV